MRNSRGRVLRPSMIPLSSILVDGHPGCQDVSALSLLEVSSGRYQLVTGRHLFYQWRRSGEDTVPALLLPPQLDHDVLSSADLADRTIDDILAAVIASRSIPLAASCFAPMFGLSVPDGVRLMGFCAKHHDLVAKAGKLGFTIAHIRLLAPLSPERLKSFRQLDTKKRSSRALASYLSGDDSSDPNLSQAVSILNEALGSKIEVSKSPTGYRVLIPFNNINVLTGLMQRIGEAPFQESLADGPSRQVRIDLCGNDEFDALFSHLLRDL